MNDSELLTSRTSGSVGGTVPAPTSAVPPDPHGFRPPTWDSGRSGRVQQIGEIVRMGFLGGQRISYRIGLRVSMMSCRNPFEPGPVWNHRRSAGPVRRRRG